MIIYLMLLISIYEQAAQSVLELQQVGLSRFTSTRLCDSQVELILYLFQTPHVDKKFGHQLLLVGAYTPLLALCCLDFPLYLNSRAIIHLPRHRYFTTKSLWDQISFFLLKYRLLISGLLLRLVLLKKLLPHQVTYYQQQLLKLPPKDLNPQLFSSLEALQNDFLVVG